MNETKDDRVKTLLTAAVGDWANLAHFIGVLRLDEGTHVAALKSGVNERAVRPSLLLAHGSITTGQALGIVDLSI